MKLPFWKFSGAGNDFVLLAGLPRGRGGPALARRLCDRRRGVGADGLLVVSRRGTRAAVSYWNADGSAAFCGNGTRCAALWAAARGWTKGESFTLETARGPLRARLTAPGRAELAMPAPRIMGPDLRLKAAGRSWKVCRVDAGVPHAAVLVPDVDALDVRTLGRALRRHRAFRPAGANVDFYSARGGALRLRTYERGVEDETLACGTGAVAAAAAARARGLAGDRVRVRVRGGDELRVSFDADGGAALEGPGANVFTGEAAL
jgi:diaminopimelate epimerase